MQKNIYLKLSVIFLFLTNAGCKKGFLDKTPLASISVESFYQTEDDAVKAVTAIYSILQTDKAFDGQFVNLLELTTDDAMGGFDRSSGMENYSFQSDFYPFTASWEALYSGISRANLVTDRVPQIKMNETKRNRLIGEAKFLRALYYFHLVNLFGGVPLLNTEIGVKEANIPKSTAEEIYKQIEKDLIDAMGVLPLRSVYSSSDAGRATKGAAEALLAKAYLFQKKWALASTAAKNVIASNEYNLMPLFRQNFSNKFNNNSEAIFEIQNSDIVKTGWNDQAVGSLVPIWARPGDVKSATGEGRGGWGSFRPTPNLDSSFEANDLRRKETVIQVDNQVIEDGWTVGTKGSGYKFWATFTVDMGEKDPYHQRIYRYADLLLVCAEALAEQGNLANAPGGSAFYLNMVRTRAGLPNTTAATKDDMVKAIRKDRRSELANEYHRLYDLRRWSIIGPTLKSVGKPFITGRHELFPIPQTQIDLSKGTLKQNPNY